MENLDLIYAIFDADNDGRLGMDEVLGIMGDDSLTMDDFKSSFARADQTVFGTTDGAERR